MRGSFSKESCGDAENAGEREREKGSFTQLKDVWKKKNMKTFYLATQLKSTIGRDSGIHDTKKDIWNTRD